MYELTTDGKGTPLLGRRCLRGFSLVEMMIVVVVLAIVALLAVPGETRREATQVQAAAKLLLADLDYACIASLGNGVDPCVVVFDEDGEGYRLASSLDAATPLTDPATGQPYQVRFGEGRAGALTRVRLTAVDTDDNQLVYNPMGGLESAGDASVTLTCGSSSLTLTIRASTGQAIIE
ncbi:MAG: prepilin-type N-terminal cleavage/methylation domain-containing protein [Phycisphaeraceae bacterium]